MPEERRGAKIEDIGVIFFILLIIILIILCLLKIICPEAKCAEGLYSCPQCAEGCCLRDGSCPCPPNTILCPPGINCPSCCDPKTFQCVITDGNGPIPWDENCTGINCSKCNTTTFRCGIGPAVCANDVECEGIECGLFGCGRLCKFGWSDCDGNGVANCRTLGGTFVCHSGECKLPQSTWPVGMSDCNIDGIFECDTSTGFSCCGNECRFDCIGVNCSKCIEIDGQKSCGGTGQILCENNANCSGLVCGKNGCQNYDCSKINCSKCIEKEGVKSCGGTGQIGCTEDGNCSGLTCDPIFGCHRFDCEDINCEECKDGKCGGSGAPCTDSSNCAEIKCDPVNDCCPEGTSWDDALSCCFSPSLGRCIPSCPSGTVWNEEKGCCFNPITAKCAYVCLDNPTLSGCPDNVDGCRNGCCPRNTVWNESKGCCLSQSSGKCIPGCPEGTEWDDGKQCCIDEEGDCVYVCATDPTRAYCDVPGIGGCGFDYCCPSGTTWSTDPSDPTKKCCLDAAGKCVFVNPCPYPCVGTGCKVTCPGGVCPEEQVCCSNSDQCKKCDLAKGLCGGIGPRKCDDDVDCLGSVCDNGQCNGVPPVELCLYACANGIGCKKKCTGAGKDICPPGQECCATNEQCNICISGQCGGKGKACPLGNVDCAGARCISGECCVDGICDGGSLIECPGIPLTYSPNYTCGTNILCTNKCMDDKRTCIGGRLPEGSCNVTGQTCTDTSHCCCGLICQTAPEILGYPTTGVCCSGGLWICYS